MTEQQPKSKVADWLGMDRATPFFVMLAVLFVLIVVLGALDVSAYWTVAVILGTTFLAGTAWQFADDGGRRGFHVAASSILCLGVYSLCGATGMFTFSTDNMWNLASAIGGSVLGMLTIWGYLSLAGTQQK